MRDSAEACEADSHDAMGMNSDHGCTRFIAEPCEGVDVLGSHYVDPTFYSDDSGTKNFNIVLNRPVTLSSGTLSSTRGTNYSFPSTLINFLSTITPNLDFAINRYAGVRATLVFRLEVAATPVHQGIVALAWQYGQYSAQTLLGVTSYPNWDRTSLPAAATSLPHVMLNLCDNKAVTLRVPYLATRDYARCVPRITPADRLDEYGKIALINLTNVPTPPSAPPPTYKLYLYAEDVEFLAPVTKTTNVLIQSGKVIKAKKPLDKEFEDEAYPFSSSLSALSRSVKFLAKGVPFISSVAGPAQWFLNSTAGAVRSFGWSKPSINEPPMRTNPIASVLEHNVDVPSACPVVGAFASNALRPDPKFAGTDVDEMSLAYLLSRPSQIYGGFLRTTDLPGYTVYSAPISPSCFWFRYDSVAPSATVSPGNIPMPTISSATTNSFYPSGLFFFSQFFRFWRGDMVFRFTFGKSSMHSGKIAVTFTPNASMAGTVGGYVATPGLSAIGIGAPDVSVSPLISGSTLIFDLANGYTFDYEVPYISDRNASLFNETTGALSMQVLEPLIGPNVVTNNVPFMVEVFAKSNFELSVPVTARYPVHEQGTVMQSGKIIKATSPPVSDQLFGEKINSVKQLIMIPKKSTVVVQNRNTTTTSAYMVLPWFYRQSNSVLVPGPVTPRYDAFNTGGLIASCYGFVRGGTDYHLYYGANTGNQANTFWIRLAPEVNAADTPTSFIPTRTPTSNDPTLVAVPTSSSGAVHARLPSYSPYARIPSCCMNGWVGAAIAFTSSNVPLPSSFPLSIFMVVWQFAQSTTLSYSIMHSRSAADDAVCGHYMGPPPLLLPGANTASTPWDADSPDSF